MVPVSRRMKAIADMVTEGLSVADIGCDHGFVVIYLLTEKKAYKAVAMDVNEGPLLRAKEHILQYGLSDSIETRLSDGAKNLKEGEVQAAIIAGMGGRLTIKIIEQSKDKFRAMNEMVLSPHSDISLLREYLDKEGFVITDEDMVFDEDKYYSIIKCSYQGKSENLSQEQLSYGPRLLEKKHPVLKEYLTVTSDKLTEIEKRLEENIAFASDSKKETLIKRNEDVKKEKRTVEGIMQLL